MLLVSVLGRKGPASVKVADIALVTVSGSEVVGGALEDMGNGDFLVTVTKVPAGEFVVLLNGTDVVSSTVFQRQSTTQMSVSKVTIKVSDADTLPVYIENRISFVNREGVYIAYWDSVRQKPWS